MPLSAPLAYHSVTMTGLPDHFSHSRNSRADGVQVP